MLWNKPLFTCLATAILALPGYAQAPAPPAAPAAPRVLRGGRSVSSGRIVSSKRGWLGVGLGDLTAERVRALKLKDDSGVEVTHIEENSPAAKAGLKEHDVILEVNNQAVEDGEQFARTIADSAPGSKVGLTVWRSGTKQNLSATLESRPQMLVFNGPDGGDWTIPMPPMPPPPGWEAMTFMTGQAPRVGFEGETLTPQLADFFGVKEGVLVRTVSEKTAASKAGLKAGDVITRVSGTPVSSTREILGIIRAIHRNVTFTVMRNHKEITLNVELAQDRISSPDREVL
ncbi:MAG: PDZ domain-containing protein [Acidobacteriota bacterium]